MLENAAVEECVAAMEVHWASREWADLGTEVPQLWYHHVALTVFETFLHFGYCMQYLFTFTHLAFVLRSFA